MNDPKNSAKQAAMWQFFTSVKLTIVLLVILAVASIFGTLIPQQEAAREFAQRIDPGLLRIYSVLDLFDMFHAFWFRILIGLLALNLIVCSLDRFPATWKRYKTRPAPDREKLFENISEEHTVLVHEPIEDTVERVRGTLRKRFKKIREKKVPNKCYFYVEKGGYSLFGVYMIHLSVLLILMGAILGSFLGFEANVNIAEGEQVDRVFLRRSHVEKKLGFEVRCDRFYLEFYENGAPKEYRSDLVFLTNGREVEKKSILVNHPAQFRGITFYQASYGSLPGMTARIGLMTDHPGMESPFYELDMNAPVKLPDNKGELEMVGLKPDFMGMGAAALISVRPVNGEEIRFWIFQNREQVEKQLPEPMANSQKFDPAAYKPYTFILEGALSRYYTGLQANKDPGVPVVWAGCITMVLGFFAAFFSYHRRIWIRVSKENRGTNISAAGTSSKNQLGLDREMENLIDTMSTK